MGAAIALALEAMQLVPSMVAAGMDVAGLVEKIIAVKDASAAPDDAAWAALDALVKQYQDSFRSDSA